MEKSKLAKALRENRIPIMLTEDEVQAIDEWRFAKHVATRSGAIRRMVQNALHLEDDLAEIMDEAEVVYNEVHLAFQRMYDTRMQHLGRHKELPPRQWTVEEVLEREAERTGALFDRAHSLYLLLLRLNNRVVVMTKTPHLRAGKAAARREIESLEQERRDYLAMTQESSENRRLMQAYSWLTDKGIFGDDADKFRDLPDDVQESRIQTAMDHLKFLSEKAQVAVDDDEIKRRKSLEPPDDDLASVIAYQVAKSPDRSVEWHLDRVIVDFYKDANPVVAARMIRAAQDAHRKRSEPDVSSKA